MDAIVGILDLGFPTAVAAWFLFRLEKRLDDLIEQQAKMLGYIRALTDKRGHTHGESTN